MDGMGWDGMVIIGHRSSKITFGTNHYLREVLDLTHSGSAIDSSSSSYPALHWAKTSTVKRILHFGKTLSVTMRIVDFAKNQDEVKINELSLFYKKTKLESKQ